MSKFGFPPGRGIGNRIGGFIGSTPDIVSGIFGLRSQQKYADRWPRAGFLYPFTSFTFTNGTQTGSEGPSLQNLLDAYDTTENSWLENTEFFNTSDGIQLWTVPRSGTYRIEAWGARGGNNTATGGLAGGLGARMRGDFALTAGQVLQILVGQHGNDASYGCSSNSGGGGTFVVDQVAEALQNSDILLIAGGGGGGGRGVFAPTQNRKDATTANNGLDGDGSDNVGDGGTNGGGGAGGSGCVNQTGGGGGGVFGDGAAAGTGGQGGLSFVNGGQGGNNGNDSGGTSLGGGFGGGGGGNLAGGGGGGYSGGGGGGLVDCSCDGMASGGGGGSFNAGTNQDNESGAHSGHGKVEITFLG